MREVVAGAGGGAAVDVQRLAAVGGPAALQAARLVLPEGALAHVDSDVDRLPGGEEFKSVFTVNGGSSGMGRRRSAGPGTWFWRPNQVPGLMETR